MSKQEVIMSLTQRQFSHLTALLERFDKKNVKGITVVSKQNSKTFWRVSTPAHASWLPPSTNLNESRICTQCVKLFKPRYPKRLFAQKSHFDNGSSNL